MNQPKLKLEHLLYGVAFLLALVVRLAGASQIPLTDAEAALALQARSLASGQSASALIGPHPLYLALTAALMFMVKSGGAQFAAGTFVARFWPALAGSLLVLLPALFRGRPNRRGLGRLPAVLMALFLAFDPGLLAVSRQAGSLSLALFFTLLAFGLWLNEKHALAGASAGLALLGGPQVWPGLIGLAVALWVSGQLKTPGGVQGGVSEEAAAPEVEAGLPASLRRALLFAIATVFFAGTLFFTIPDGLSVMTDSIPAYLRGWVGVGVPAGLLLMALLAYELFPLIFGLWGAVAALARGMAKTSRVSRVDLFLLAWWLSALILALVYPGRQVIDLAWLLVPLWGLAARQVARLVTVPAYDRLTMLGQMVMAAVILAYLSMLLVSQVNAADTTPVEYPVRLAVALLMLVASTGLIAWGWSRMVALRGLSWALGLVLLVYMVAGGWNSVGLSGRAGEELWSAGPRVHAVDLLETVSDFNQWSGQTVGGPDIVVTGLSSPALEWLLRGAERISYTSQLPANSTPALVITPGQPELALAATYRGQGFILEENVNWGQFKPVDWFRWMVFRTAPAEMVRQEQIILWARVDLFPGGSLNKPAGAQNSGQTTP